MTVVQLRNATEGRAYVGAKKEPGFGDIHHSRHPATRLTARIDTAKLHGAQQIRAKELPGAKAQPPPDGRIARSAGQPQREGPRAAARELDPAIANLGADLLALSQTRRWQSLTFLLISGPHDGLDVESELGAVVAIERHEAARLVVKNYEPSLD
jgi:hypothetical protein